MIKSENVTSITDNPRSAIHSCITDSGIASNKTSSRKVAEGSACKHIKGIAETITAICECESESEIPKIKVKYEERNNAANASNDASSTAGSSSDFETDTSLSTDDGTNVWIECISLPSCDGEHFFNDRPSTL
jgi:hypothetical protein